MATQNTNDPLAAFVEFALDAGTHPDKGQRLADYMARIAEVGKRAERLAVAWHTEASVLSSGTQDRDYVLIPAQRAPKSGAPAETIPALATYLAQNPDASVRKASLAVIHFAGRQRSAGVLAILQAHHFEFGKGPAGNQVRSALWHARKGGQIIEEDGFQELAPEVDRSIFADAGARTRRKRSAYAE